MNVNNLKELSKPITIKGIPRENILITGIISVPFISTVNLIAAMGVFVILFSILSLITRKDIDIVKIYIISFSKIGKTFTKNSQNGNFYVS
jgi:type IV secretory pathway VirB3-like protein